MWGSRGCLSRTRQATGSTRRWGTHASISRRCLRPDNPSCTSGRSGLGCTSSHRLLQQLKKGSGRCTMIASWYCTEAPVHELFHLSFFLLVKKKFVSARQLAYTSSIKLSFWQWAAPVQEHDMARQIKDNMCFVCLELFMRCRVVEMSEMHVNTSSYRQILQ